jgi:hypothetical protein
MFWRIRMNNTFYDWFVIMNTDLPECDPCIENPGLPECVEPCPDGRPRNADGTCPSPPSPPDPCEENPDLPECQQPSPGTTQL